MLGFLVVGIPTLGSYLAAIGAGDAAVNQLSPAARASSQLTIGVSGMDRGVSSYLRTQEAVSLEPYVEGSNSSAAAITQLRESLSGVGQDLESRVDQAAVSRDLWIATVADPVIALVRGGNIAKARAAYGLPQSQSTYELMRSQASALDASVDTELNSQFTDLRESATVLGAALLVAAAALVVCAREREM